MKKETIFAAVVFFGIGFLAGYIADAQLNWNGRQRAETAATPKPSGAETSGAVWGGGGMGLPEGHPPIDAASVTKQLMEDARQNPKDPDPPLRLANFLYDQRQYQQAIEWYQRSLALNPRNINARTDMGTAYFYIGQPRQAVKEYAKSLAIEPGDKPTLLNLIVVNLEGTHDVAAARQAWDRLHKLDPANPALPSLKRKLDAAGASSPLP